MYNLVLTISLVNTFFLILNMRQLSIGSYITATLIFLLMILVIKGSIKFTQFYTVDTKSFFFFFFCNGLHCKKSLLLVAKVTHGGSDRHT